MGSAFGCGGESFLLLLNFALTVHLSMNTVKSPVVTWKEQASKRETRKRKRIADELDDRDPKLLCTYEEGLARLPLELVFEIFSSLDVFSKIAAAGVCRRWRALALNPYMWRHTVILATKCSTLRKVFKLALIGGHVESLVLAHPVSDRRALSSSLVPRYSINSLPLSDAAVTSWFREACVNLKSLRIDGFTFNEAKLPSSGIFSALSSNCLESVFIHCPSSASRSVVLSQLEKCPKLKSKVTVKDTKYPDTDIYLVKKST